MIRPARPSLAEVPLADASLKKRYQIHRDGKGRRSFTPKVEPHQVLVQHIDRLIALWPKRFTSSIDEPLHEAVGFGVFPLCVERFDLRKNFLQLLERYLCGPLRESGALGRNRKACAGQDKGAKSTTGNKCKGAGRQDIHDESLSSGKLFKATDGRGYRGIGGSRSQ